MCNVVVCHYCFYNCSIPLREIIYQQREEKRQERKAEKKEMREKKRDEVRREREEKRRERRREKENKKHKKQDKKKSDSKIDCNAPDMKCFTFDNNHWETPPLWNSKLYTSHTVFCYTTISICVQGFRVGHTLLVLGKV